MTRVMIAMALTALLAGCGTANPCEQRTDYKRVGQTPPIKVPGNLDSLSDEQSLVIPTASTPPDVDTSCLEKPPRFFDETSGEGS